MTPQAPDKLRTTCAWCALVGFVLLCLGGTVMVILGKGPQSLPGGYVAMVGLAMIAAGVLTIFSTSLCPFCRKWVHPWYCPRPSRPDLHCPYCGKSHAES